LNRHEFQAKLSNKITLNKIYLSDFFKISGHDVKKQAGDEFIRTGIADIGS
jgi:hypothetical protein